MAAAEWQPIETAPKTGEYIIAFNGEKPCWERRQDVDLWYWGTNGYGKTCWRRIRTRSVIYDSKHRQPTHWQPYPAPPTADGA